jgi:hypothetical protein
VAANAFLADTVAANAPLTGTIAANAYLSLLLHQFHWQFLFLQTLLQAVSCAFFSKPLLSTFKPTHASLANLYLYLCPLSYLCNGVSYINASYRYSITGCSFFPTCLPNNVYTTQSGSLHNQMTRHIFYS